MDNQAIQEHWEKVYQSKTPDQVSWTQAIPQSSLDLINSFYIDKTASIIDIGGGDSTLVDCLLELGYSNITVLDISNKALQRAKDRLGDKADKVQWIVSDITQFNPPQSYDIWHDRAVFHFLTSDEDIARYVAIANRFVKHNMVIATFSDNGPKKCSNLPVNQYSADKLQQVFRGAFIPLNSFTQDHTTPFDTVQNFVWCSFEKIAD